MPVTALQTNRDWHWQQTSLTTITIAPFSELPNSDRADLGDKLEAYSLNFEHWEGRHKERVFQAALGITLENAEALRRALLHAATNSDEAESRGDNGFGEGFVLRFPMETPVGRAIVLTAWIILHEEDFPRLTTCYIV